MSAEKASLDSPRNSEVRCQQNVVPKHTCHPVGCLRLLRAEAAAFETTVLAEALRRMRNETTGVCVRSCTSFC